MSVTDAAVAADAERLWAAVLDSDEYAATAVVLGAADRGLTPRTSCSR